MQCADANGGTIFRHRDISASPEEHEHRIALGALFDEAFAPAEMVETRTLQKGVELFLLQTLEKRFFAQYLARLLLIFRALCPWVGVPIVAFESDKEWKFADVSVGTRRWCEWRR